MLLTTVPVILYGDGLVVVWARSRSRTEAEEGQQNDQATGDRPAHGSISVAGTASRSSVGLSPALAVMVWT